MSLPIPNLMALPKMMIIIIMGGMMFLGFVIFLVVILIMGTEGRYHLKRGFNKRGVDLLNYDRTSNALISDTIRFNGKYWTNNKGGIYETIDTIKNPDESQKVFNEAIGRTPHWEGNRRPVLFAVEELFFTFTPDFLDLIQKATPKGKRDNTLFNIESLTGNNPVKQELVEANIENTADDKTKDIDESSILNWLKTRFKDNVKAIHILKPIGMNIITDHIDGATPYALRKSHDEGEDSGILKMTKPKKGIELGTKGKIAIGAGAIMLVIILIVMLQKGGIKLPGRG
jgi:hypothetical protein